MDFKLRFDIPSNLEQIRPTDHVLLSGSCFAEHIGSYLQRYKFRTLTNPNGILFNPASMEMALSSLPDEKNPEENIFLSGNVWHSWMHHGSFSALGKRELLETLKNNSAGTLSFIKKTEWLILSFGSAFVYELKDSKQIVANCHKVPQNRFNKRLLGMEEIAVAYKGLFEKLRGINPALKIILTISPVRYIRDGLVQNNRSKSILIQAVQQLTESIPKCFYFPAYEIVMDELRDYRFFKEDFAHPNDLAVAYVWERFIEVCMTPESRKMMKELEPVLSAFGHRPLLEADPAHQKFLSDSFRKCSALQETYPFMDLSKELEHFKGS